MVAPNSDPDVVDINDLEKPPTSIPGVQLSVPGGSPIREAMAKQLPACTQWLMTTITGVAPAGAEPKVLWTPFGIAVHALTLLLLGGMAGVLAVFIGCWALLLLPPCWIVSTGAARALMTTTLHDAVHRLARRKSRRRLLTRVAAEIISTLLFVAPFRVYSKDHLDHHKFSIFAGLMDPDFVFLRRWLYPGKSTKQLWERFVFTLVNPWFHLVFFWARMKSQLLDGGILRATMTIAYLASLVGIGVFYDLMLPILLGWVVPLVFCLQAAALTQFTSEHRWGKLADLDKPLREQYAILSSGRFCGSMPPSPGLPPHRAVWGWTVWIISMIGHAVVRWTVLPYDLVSHDLHHHHSLERLGATGEMPCWVNWANSSHARNFYLRHRQDRILVTEIWGIKAAIMATLHVLAELPETYGTGSADTSTVFTGM